MRVHLLKIVGFYRFFSARCRCEFSFEKVCSFLFILKVFERVKAVLVPTTTNTVSEKLRHRKNSVEILPKFKIQIIEAARSLIKNGNN